MIQEKSEQAFATEKKESGVKEVRIFLCSYQFCLDILQLRKYERRRARRMEIPEDVEFDNLIAGSEFFWRARMYEIETFINAIPFGRERLLLYYHYIRGESIEHVANILGISRRTAYRIHTKALIRAAALYRRIFG